MAVAVVSLVLVVVVSVGSGLTSQRVRDAGDYLTSMSKALKPPIKLIGNVPVVVVDHFRGGCIFCFFSRGGPRLSSNFYHQHCANLSLQYQFPSKPCQEHSRPSA